MKFKILAVSVLLAASQSGCGRDQAAPPASVSVAPAPESAPKRNPEIPADVTYAVVHEEEEYQKRIIDVDLNKRVSTEVLGEIARELKAKETSPHERTFIFYHLPSPEPGRKLPPWATSHFNPMPDLPTFRAEILGLTAEAKQELESLPITRGDELVGAWIVDVQLVSRRVTIFKAEGGFKLEAVAPPGGERWVTDLTEIPSSAGHRFKKAGSSDQYEIDSEGVLRIYGSGDRVIAAAWPMSSTSG